MGKAPFGQVAALCVEALHDWSGAPSARRHVTGGASNHPAGIPAASPGLSGRPPQGILVAPRAMLPLGGIVGRALRAADDPIDLPTAPAPPIVVVWPRRHGCTRGSAF